VSAVGHEIDVTLADLVADVRALTPSEAAERIVPSADDVSDLVRGLGLRLRMALSTRVAHIRSRLDSLASRPALRCPQDGVLLRTRRADELSVRLHAAAQTNLRDWRSAVTGVAGKLEALSPLGVLGRGYSLTYAEGSDRLITAASQLRPGQRIHTRFQRGAATSVVESIEKDSN
jgi:exodeoxyribonuclease VII large subunit